MNKRIAIAVVVAVVGLSVANAHAQVSVVTGEVVYRDLRPAVNCTVVLGNRFAFVDIRGRFRILNVPFGTYVLQIQKQGRKLKEIRITINQPQVVLPRLVL